MNVVWADLVRALNSRHPLLGALSSHCFRIVIMVPRIVGVGAPLHYCHPSSQHILYPHSHSYYSCINNLFLWADILEWLHSLREMLSFASVVLCWLVLDDFCIAG